MEEIKYKGMDDDGRSMVEMLGVLSVIGVLSATAVYGYRTAMDSHHASETVDRIMKRAMMVSSQRLLGQAADISAFTETGAYEIPNVVDTSTPGKFGLTVNGVPEKVCSKIKAYDWKLPVIMPGECGESNDMEFIFNDDLSLVADATEPEEPSCDNVVCTAPQFCDQGKCVCPKNAEGVQMYGPNCNSDCDGFKRWNNTGCWPCDTLDSISGCGNTSDCVTQCPNREVWNGNYCILKQCPENYFRRNAGACIPCSTSGIIMAFTQQDCSSCSNRELRNAYSGDTGCWPTLAPGQFRDYYGNVQNCNQIDAYGYVGTNNAQANTCVACGNRYVTSAGWCAFTTCPDGYIRDNNTAMGTCYSCAQDDAIYLNADEESVCTSCPGREFMEMDGYYLCVKSCDSGFRDSSGHCWTCDEPDDIWYVSEQECDKCGNRTFGQDFDTGYDVCYFGN